MDKPKATGPIRHLPNIASFIRIFGTLSLPFIMMQHWEIPVSIPFLRAEGPINVPWIWVIAFLFLALTDTVDGKLARRLHAESDLGAGLDAIGDAVLMVTGATCVFVYFAENIHPIGFKFWFYMFIMVQILSDKIIVFFISKKRFGEGNMLHSLPHKAFAVGAIIAITLWAFARAIDTWSIVILWAIMTYAFVDELIYLKRSATYNVDFKGHGLETYPLREDKS